MNKIKVFEDFKQDFQCLTYENHKDKEKLSLRFTLLISHILNADSAYIEKFNNVTHAMVHSGVSGGGNPIFKKHWIVSHETALKIIDDVIEDLELINSIDDEAMAETIEKDYSKVFIVHGHDDGAVDKVARFVGKLDFEAIILHEQSSSGDTIIEKIIRYSDVGFGIVLYTECDVGAVKSQPNNLKPRARQNVVFEHGFLIGKIGRENIVALVKGNVEKPNDISGVVYISLDESEGWKLSLVKEMIASGYNVDMSKIL